jgi:6-phosphogluconolactonase (cycloisomerase 2 family)
MSSVSRLGAATLALAVPAAFAVSAATSAGVAAAAPAGDARHVVFVQNDDPSGNVVFAYDRAHNGKLTLAHRYPTGGRGGVLDGSVVDHLASEGALTLDRAHRLLFAVNAGSNTLSVFAVNGDRLSLRQTLHTGGRFPVSVGVSGRLVYVLNARRGGSVSGFRIDGQQLQAISHSTRALGLDPHATPEFTSTPGQVSFSPDGRLLLVTTKANGNDVDVFPVRGNGRLAAPTVNSLPGTVPFAGAFDQAGHFVLAEAGPNAVATFALDHSRTLTPLDSVSTGQAATCWIAGTGGYFYASNAGSASLSRLTTEADGSLNLLGQSPTDTGTVDASASSDGRFLYVQTGGSGVVDEERVANDGTLTQVGTITVPNAVGAEGIAAS